MRTKHAREIRRGIETARAVLARKRQWPSHMTPFGFRGAPEMPLWERAFHREMTKAVRDGRLRPPRGGSGVSRPDRYRQRPVAQRFQPQVRQSPPEPPPAANRR